MSVQTQKLSIAQRNHSCVRAHPHIFAALYLVLSFFSCLLQLTPVLNFLHLVSCFDLFDLFEFLFNDCSSESTFSDQSAAF